MIKKKKKTPIIFSYKLQNVNLQPRNKLVGCLENRLRQNNIIIIDIHDIIISNNLSI